MVVGCVEEVRGQGDDRVGKEIKSRNPQRGRGEGQKRRGFSGPERQAGVISK